MTEVAAVSGHVNASAGPGVAKGGTPKGAGSVLDGAFAAIFGAAGGKNATDGANVKLPGQAKPGGQALDPALTGDAAEVDPQALLADADIKTDPTDAPDASPTPRKPGTRRKSDADQSDAQALPLLGAFAAVTANAPQPSLGKQPTAPTKDGIQSIKVAADVSAAAGTTVLATPAPDSGKADAGKDSGKGAKSAPVADAQPQAATTPTDNLAVAAPRHGEQSPDPRNGNGNNATKDHDQPASQQRAANDDSAGSTAGSLQDIMQSLPPVVQAQMNVADVGLAALPAVSTGDQLGNQVIDMSVQGQWIDRMAREIATLASGTGHSSFQLSPPNLGKIQVDLMQSGDKTDVRILAETDEAARRLRDGQGALEANARVASLSLGSVSVEKSSAPFDARNENGRQSPDSGGNSQQQQQASAQAQGQSGQNRGGAGVNRGGFGAVMGQEQEADTETAIPVDRAGDPGVRFA